MKGLILLILATLLLLILTFVNVCIVLFKSIKKEGLKGFKTVSGYFKNSALNLDVYAAKEFRAFWNATCQKDGYLFGQNDESISYVLGINQINGTLSFFGFVLCEILNIFEKNHCTEAVKLYNKKHNVK